MSEEIQISAGSALPRVGGQNFKSVNWFLVTPERVVVCRSGGEATGWQDVVEELDTRKVQLSGFKPGD